MHCAPIAEEVDRAAHVAHQGLRQLGYLAVAEVVWLEGPIEPGLLPLGEHGQGRQRRDPVVRVTIGDDRLPASRRPSALPSGDEQQATFI